MNRVACHLLRLSLTAGLLTFAFSSPGAGKEQAGRGTASVNGTRLAYEIQGKGRVVVLIGLSLGGMIATDFALERPEMVERLVLTSSALRGYQSPRNKKTVAVGKAAEERGMQSAIELWLEHPFFATGKGDAAYQRRMRTMLADNYRYWGPLGA